MHTFWQDVRYSLRMLRKNPGFAAVAVLSLALGIGANTTIFTVVNAILLNPLPVKNITRLVEVDTIDSKTLVTAANATKLGMSYPNFQDYARENQVFASVGCFVGPLPLTWSGGAEPRQIFGQMVSANYFEILGLRPASGRFFLPDEDTKPGGNNVAVVSYSLWANKFGSDPHVVGRILTLNATPYTVIGVAPHGFKGTFTFGNAEQVWIPVSMYPQLLAGFFKDNFNDRRFLTTAVIGRLKDGVSLGEAEASLKTHRVASRERISERQRQPECGADTSRRGRCRSEQSQSVRARRWIDDGNRGFGPSDRMRESGKFTAGSGCSPRKRDWLESGARSQPGQGHAAIANRKPGARDPVGSCWLSDRLWGPRSVVVFPAALHPGWRHRHRI